MSLLLLFTGGSQVTTPYLSGSNPDPVWVQSYQFDMGSEAPLRAPTAKEGVAAWQCLTNQPIFPKPRLTPTGAVYPLQTMAPPAETVTLDKWDRRWPDPYFRPKRLVQYGINVAIAAQDDNGLPPTWWMPPSNQPLPPKPTRLQWSEMRPLNIFVPPAGIFNIGWLPSVNQPLKQPPRRQPWFEMRPLVFPISVDPGQRFIAGQNVEPIWITTFQYDTEARPLQFTAPVAPFNIGWLPPVNQPLPRLLGRQPWLEMRPLSLSTPPFHIGWMPPVNQPLFKAKERQPWSEMRPLNIFVPPAAPFNIGWMPPVNQPLRQPLRFSAHLQMPLAFVHATIITPPSAAVKFRRTLSLFGTRVGGRQEEEYG
jgi:hypothetical protein